MVKMSNWDSPSHTFTFTARDLASALMASADWLSHHDNPVNLTCTVESHPIPMTVGQVEWQVKIVSWAGWETPAISEDK